MLQNQLNHLEGSRCLVLGGRGFIGSHLINALLNKGFLVRCFDRPYINTIEDSYLDNSNFELYLGDFLCESDLADAVKGCDFCYHLVSTTLPKSSNADPIYDIESNVLGTIRLLNYSVSAGIKKIIFASSGGTVYGVQQESSILESHPTNPICSYGISKLAIEKYLSLYKLNHGLDYTVLRLANPYGELQPIDACQGVIAVFLGKVLRREVVEIWGDGSIIRDYIHISDVVDAFVSALYHSEHECVFNIGTGQGHSLNEILSLIERVTGEFADRRYLLERSFDIPVNILGIESAKRILHWSPKIKIDEGLTRFANWLRESHLIQ